MSIRARVSLPIWVFACSIFCGLTGCLEEFEPENITNVIEGALVVDARISDQEMQHSIFLSRTFSLGDFVPLLEEGAEVSISDDLGNRFYFLETTPGTYSTIGAIAFTEGVIYTLEVTTVDGVRYSSEKVTLPKKVEITGLHAEKRINSSENEGIAILVDNMDTSGSPNYFRYEYEETYKIVAPYRNPFDWDEIDYDINDGDGWEVTIAARDERVDICYGTNESNNIILASTADLGANTLDDFEVRFIGQDNYAISNRYSILVKQYHHDINANSFFRLLEDFSSVESIFSNVQTGSFEGNITVQNSDVAIVFGYFELSSYSEKRLFLNYGDFFPDAELPSYIINCATGAPALYPRGFHITQGEGGELIIDGTNSSPLIEGILAGLYAYHADNEDFEDTVNSQGFGGAAPFLIKPLGCVDCRIFGSSVEPDFWIE